MSPGTMRWHGTLTGIQPRIRLNRSFDERWETYLGYVLRIQGHVREQAQAFSVGITEALHAHHQLQVGDTLSGVALPVASPDLDPVDYDQTTSITMIRPAPPRPRMAPRPRGKSLPLTLQSIRRGAIVACDLRPTPFSAVVVSGVVAWRLK